MHLELAGVGFALHGLLAATTTTTKAKSTSSSYAPIILILIVVGAYMLFIRPQRAKLRQQQQAGPDVNVGDEIITSSGIIGRVQRFEGDRVAIEIAPGTTVMIFRNALGRRLPPRAADDEYYPPPADRTGVEAHDSADEPPEGDSHADGASADGPWWPGPTGDATPSSGGTT